VIDKQALLNELRQSILDNKVCPELADGATQLVMGDGNPDADIVFIGEAPGKKEDEQGIPFVGASGRFLNEMLESIGLERQDVYITNIVKYRPPKNRDPSPQEKADFMPYLEQQLAIIDPKLIITLGRHSMNMFLPDQQISQTHGQPKRINRNVYLPLYHPAAALYNGSMRQTLLDDFAQVPKILLNINRIK
jgi:DNA polymerase